MSKPQHTQEQLIAILQAGKPEEFGVLYDYFSGALYGVISKIIDDNDMAQDILQESFVKIWEKSKSYDPSKGRLFTWMLNIARNTAIDASRSKHVKAAAKIQNTDDNVRMIDKQINVSQSDESMDVAEIVNKLVPEHRVILDMMYFQGFSQDEVSKELGIPLGTVKTRARNAIIKLRETFNFLVD
jgi:RNA polymerase sigma factor (sigma-70 family)